MPDRPDPIHKADTPRWVKVQGTLVAILILIVIGMAGGGGHGPAGDTPANHAPPEEGHR